MTEPFVITWDEFLEVLGSPDPATELQQKVQDHFALRGRGPSQFVGAGEAAAILGVKPSNLIQARAGRFPEPVARLPRGMIWLRRDIKRAAKAERRRAKKRRST